MEFLLVLITTLAISVSSGIFPKSKDSNQSEEVKVIQTKEIKPPVVKAKPEPVQTEAAKPEPVQTEATNELNVNGEEINWLNIILYALGVVIVIATGIYFFTRREATPLTTAADSGRRDFNEETQPEPPAAQEETQPEQPEAQEETQSTETNEDNSSEDNNK